MDVRDEALQALLAAIDDLVYSVGIVAELAAAMSVDLIRRNATRDPVYDIVYDITIGPFGGDSSDVTSSGGNVRDGELFTIFVAAGGLTGSTSVTINSIACTSPTVIDDFNMTAVAPTDDLLHGTSYTMNIS